MTEIKSKLEDVNLDQEYFSALVEFSKELEKLVKFALHAHELGVEIKSRSKSHIIQADKTIHYPLIRPFPSRP